MYSKNNKKHKTIIIIIIIIIIIGLMLYCLVEQNATEYKYYKNNDKIGVVIS